MFPVKEAIFRVKKSDFGVTASIIQQWQLYRILGREALVATGRMQLRCYNSDDGGGSKLRRRVC